MSGGAGNEALVAHRRELGAAVVGVVAVVDRGGACAALLEPEGIPFAALVTAPDLGFPYEGAG